MNFIMYMGVFGLLSGTVNSIGDEYNILKKFRSIPNAIDVFDIVNGTDNFDAIQIKAEDNIAIQLKEFKPPLRKLTVPFNIQAIVSIDLESCMTCCIFSIVTNQASNFSLCYDIIGIDKIKIYLQGINHENKGKALNNVVENSWKDIVLRVNEDSVIVYVDCEKLYETSTKENQDIIFEDESTLYLGRLNEFDETNYQSAIQAINITPGDKSIEDICPKDLSDITLANSGGQHTDQPKAAFLTKFADTFSSDSEEEDSDKENENGDYSDERSGGDTTDSLEPQDLKGLDGERGMCQCTESIVSDILQSLIKSTPDLRGPRGEDGSTGRPGLTGLPGVQGESGPTGPQGLKGEAGIPGLPGGDGLTGAKGEPGKDGVAGPPGPPGECVTVEKKTEDTKGDLGPMGPPGTPGHDGTKGDKGDKGDQGIKGDRGDEVTKIITYKGADGRPGAQGDKGAPGEPGLNGLPGTPGAHGRPGTDGQKGEKGDRGDIGLPGLPAKLTSILDTTIDPEETSAVVEKLRGLTGDKGATGPKGEKGELGFIGLQGPPGKDGSDGTPGEKGHRGHTGEAGPVGPKGDRGEPGQPGAPGNVPEAAISLLKGAKGDRGAPGKTGDRGHTGHPGKRGPVGPPGPKGSSGDRGPTGFKGEKGDRGTDGRTGPKGEKGEIPFIDYKKLKGDKGDRGGDGMPGEDGRTGDPGTCDATTCVSYPGPPGPPGPPGTPGVSLTGPKGEPGGIVFQNGFGQTGKLFDDTEDVYSAATVIFKSTSVMLKRTTTTPLGTIAYVLQERILLVRVENGWQNIEMGSLFSARSSSYSHTEYPIETYRTSRRITNDKASYMRLIALNEPYPGNMLTSANRTGRNAVNQECFKQAKKRFQGANNFVAFLTNKLEDLRSLVKTEADRQVPIVNLRGEVLFDSWLDLFNGSGAPVAMKKIYSFNGQRVSINKNWPDKAIWHGSDSFGIRVPRAFCEEWQNNRPLDFGMASPLEGNKLLEQRMYPCDSRLIVLCVEASSRIERLRRSPSRRRLRHLRRDDYLL